MQLFPFHYYFSDAPQPLFPETATLAEATEIARGCYDGHLTDLFTQLAEMRGTARITPSARSRTPEQTEASNWVPLFSTLPETSVRAGAQRVRPRQLPPDQGGQDHRDDLHTRSAEAARGAAALKQGILAGHGVGRGGREPGRRHNKSRARGGVGWGGRVPLRWHNNWATGAPSLRCLYHFPLFYPFVPP